MRRTSFRICSSTSGGPELWLNASATFFRLSVVNLRNNRRDLGKRDYVVLVIGPAGGSLLSGTARMGIMETYLDNQRSCSKRASCQWVPVSVRFVRGHLSNSRACSHPVTLLKHFELLSGSKVRLVISKKLATVSGPFLDAGRAPLPELARVGVLLAAPHTSRAEGINRHWHAEGLPH